MRYEYRTHATEVGSAMNDWLNARAAEGWELYQSSAIPMPGGDYNQMTPWLVVVMRRAVVSIA